MDIKEETSIVVKSETKYEIEHKYDLEDEIKNIDENGFIKEEDNSNYSDYVDCKSEPTYNAVAVHNIEEFIYACEKCSYESKSKRNLADHIALNHDVNKKKYCGQCDHVSSNRRTLRYHIKTVHAAAVHNIEGFIYPCEKCDYEAKSKGDLTKHFAAVHEGSKKCEQCDHVATNKIALKVHIRFVHKGIKYSCDKCSFQAKRRDDLVQHISSVHKGITYDCEECEYTTKVKKFLPQHIDIVHKGFTYSCEKCEYKSMNRKHLRNHIDIVHKGVKNECSQCDYIGSNKLNLSNHIESVHDNIRYYCNLCEYQSRSKSYLKVHVRGVHEGVTVGIRNLRCKQCKFKSRFDSRLKKHITLVHGSEVLYCEQCDFKTEYKSRHMAHVEKVHEKNLYACEKCDYKASSKKSLNQHSGLTHKDGYAFICELCGYKASFEKVLKRHKESVHKENSIPNRGEGDTTKRVEKINNGALNSIVSTVSYVENNTIKEGNINTELQNFDEEVNLHKMQAANYEHENIEPHIRSNYHEISDVQKTIVWEGITADINADGLEINSKTKFIPNNSSDYDQGDNRSESDCITKIKKDTPNKKDISDATCEVCAFKTSVKADLLQHMVSIHIGMNYDCEVCDTENGTSKETMCSICRFKCDHCNFKGINIRNLKEHQQYVHERQSYIEESLNCKIQSKTIVTSVNIENYFNCERCDFKGGSEVEICEHVSVSHDEVKYKCKQCRKQFASVEVLNEHIKTVHKSNDSNLYKCELCNYKQNSISKLREHFESLHKTKIFSDRNDTTLSATSDKSEKDVTDDKAISLYEPAEMAIYPNTCQVCLKSFRVSSEHRRHMIVHSDEKSFVCTECHKAVKTSNALKVHMRIHTGEKPFHCGTCSKSHLTKNSLQIHCDLTKHTFPEQFKKVRKSGEDSFQCHLCPKSFPKNNLKVHLRTHTKEKPFLCTLCPKSFSQNITLKNHMRSHTGEKPFTCDMCPKSFSSYSSLWIHLKKHSKEK